MSARFYSPVRLFVRTVLLAAFLACTAGCSSLRSGGAPEPSFSVEKDLAELASHFEQASSISNFYHQPSKEERNKFVAGRLVLMNIRYIQFVRKSTAEKQLLDSAVDILTLSLNLAGASTGSATTKTILAAIEAGLTGSKATYDKNYMFEKTIPALIAAMNAQRKEALLPLLEGMKRELADYPFEQAVTDLHQYYFAGTFLGAIQAIQSDAGEKERSAQKKIVTLSALSDSDVVIKLSLTKAIGALSEEDFSKVKAALKVLAPTQEATATFEAGKEALQDHVRQATTPKEIERVGKIFKDAGILK